MEDLHVTVVYVGPGWKVDDLERIRGLALVAPPVAATLRPEAVRLGRSAHVVAVELHEGPVEWAAAVVAAKAEMNRLGLKKPDRYDAEFRPHVTLAAAKGPTPDRAQATELDAFQAWLAERLATDPGRFAVAVGPRSPVRLWLAGLERPAGAPEYVDLEAALGGR